MPNFNDYPKVLAPLITKRGDVVLTPYQCELIAKKLGAVCGWLGVHLSDLPSDVSPNKLDLAKLVMEIAEYFDQASEQSIEMQRKWL